LVISKILFNNFNNSLLLKVLRQLIILITGFFPTPLVGFNAQAAWFTLEFCNGMAAAKKTKMMPLPGRPESVTIYAHSLSHNIVGQTDRRTELLKQGQLPHTDLASPFPVDSLNKNVPHISFDHPKSWSLLLCACM